MTTETFRLIHGWLWKVQFSLRTFLSSRERVTVTEEERHKSFQRSSLYFNQILSGRISDSTLISMTLHLPRKKNTTVRFYYLLGIKSSNFPNFFIFTFFIFYWDIGFDVIPHSDLVSTVLRRNLPSFGHRGPTESIGSPFPIDGLWPRVVTTSLV